MIDPPSPSAILDGVSRFLREHAAPALSGHLAFEARVAAHALEILARQAAYASIAEDAERARLLALLPGETGDLLALNRRLCERIAAGAFEADDPDLSAHLWATTLAKLAIDQPTYSTYRAHTQTATPPKGA